MQKLQYAYGSTILATLQGQNLPLLPQRTPQGCLKQMHPVQHVLVATIHHLRRLRFREGAQEGIWTGLSLREGKDR